VAGVRRPLLNRRLEGFGTTIFADMSALAAGMDAVNLGQGFPDTDGPVEVTEAARVAISSGQNQYAPGIGVEALRRAISAHQQRFYGLGFDPEREVLATTGATEAIAATILALCDPGDSVVTFEPYYDSYAASIALAGAEHRVVPLRAPDWSFDPGQLAEAITDRTRLVLLNSPHNPTGKVFGAEELAAIAELCVERDVIAVTDEVYEHLVFEGEHIPLSSFPGMRDRTVTISSAGKTFSVTGWKIGWICASFELVAAVRTVKQFLTYASGTPFQHAVAEGLGLPDPFYEKVAAALRDKRDQLCCGLEQLGFAVMRPASTYFAIVDVRSVGYEDGFEFCKELITRFGVAAIPTEVFYTDRAAGRPLVRFAFCKRPEVLAEAIARLSLLARP
jgi:N-succinyldiaminopimelate aminotransferase